jgi:hypothetical protein
MNVEKKVTFSQNSNSDSNNSPELKTPRIKAKLKRPINWNGLDSLDASSVVLGSRGGGFTGNKSGMLDIRHFIEEENIRQKKLLK